MIRIHNIHGTTNKRSCSSSSGAGINFDKNVNVNALLENDRQQTSVLLQQSQPQQQSVHQSSSDEEKNSRINASYQKTKGCTNTTIENSSFNPHDIHSNKRKNMDVSDQERERKVARADDHSMKTLVDEELLSFVLAMKEREKRYYSFDGCYKNSICPEWRRELVCEWIPFCISCFDFGRKAEDEPRPQASPASGASSTIPFSSRIKQLRRTAIELSVSFIDRFFATFKSCHEQAMCQLSTLVAVKVARSLVVGFDFKQMPYDVLLQLVDTNRSQCEVKPEYLATIECKMLENLKFSLNPPLGSEYLHLYITLFRRRVLEKRPTDLNSYLVFMEERTFDLLNLSVQEHKLVEVPKYIVTYVALVVMMEYCSNNPESGCNVHSFHFRSFLQWLGKQLFHDEVGKFYDSNCTNDFSSSIDHFLKVIGVVADGEADMSSVVAMKAMNIDASSAFEDTTSLRTIRALLWKLILQEEGHATFAHHQGIDKAKAAVAATGSVVRFLFATSSADEAHEMTEEYQRSSIRTSIAPSSIPSSSLEEKENMRCALSMMESHHDYIQSFSSPQWATTTKATSTLSSFGVEGENRLFIPQLVRTQCLLTAAALASTVVAFPELTVSSEDNRQVEHQLLWWESYIDECSTLLSDKNVGASGTEISNFT